MIKKISLLVVALAIVGAWFLFGSQKQATSANDQTEQAADKTAETKVASTDGAPRIEFPETTHDFGVIQQNATVTHTFRVRNTGDAPLELLKAAAS